LNSQGAKMESLFPYGGKMKELFKQAISKIVLSSQHAGYLLYMITKKCIILNHIHPLH
jgi:hypothetical protein